MWPYDKIFVNDVRDVTLIDKLETIKKKERAIKEAHAGSQSSQSLLSFPYQLSLRS